MKKYLIYSISITILLLVISITANNQFYGSKIEFFTCVTALIILTIQFAGTLIVGTKQLIDRKINPVTVISAVCYLLFLSLVIGFIFNGMIWSTDTGTFRVFCIE